MFRKRFLNRLSLIENFVSLLYSSRWEVKNFMRELSEKLLHALSITQISKDDYADFRDF